MKKKAFIFTTIIISISISLILLIYTKKNILVEINNSTQFENIIEKKQTSIVYFYKPDCPWCKDLNIILEPLLKKYGSSNFYKVDLSKENNRVLIKKLNIEGVPTIISYNKGVESNKIVGCETKDVYEGIFKNK